MHFMVDLETLDTKPTAAILSIGAVCFDPLSGWIGDDGFYVNVHPDSCYDAGLTSSEATVSWWVDQSQSARDVLMVDRQPLTVALDDLSSFLCAPDPRIWAHSPAFDLVILENAYRSVGWRARWNHRARRDTRTIFDLAGVNLSDFASGTYHNALDDARNQARAVCEAYRRLGLAS